MGCPRREYVQRLGSQPAVERTELVEEGTSLYWGSKIQEHNLARLSEAADRVTWERIESYIQGCACPELLALLLQYL